MNQNNSQKMESFTDLVVWQKSHELVLSLYKMTEKFPKSERDGLALRMRTEVAQVPVNIASGFKKRQKNAKIYYYRAAFSTIEQIRYDIMLAKDLKYLKEVDGLLDSCDQIEKMMRRLIRSVS
jgi:four helix bundle protein